MNVACRRNRLASEPANLANFPVQFLKFLFSGDFAITNQKFIVSARLYLKIVIERCDLQQIIHFCAIEHRPVQLSRLAGGPQNQAFPEFDQCRTGNSGCAVKVLDMGQRNQSVQIPKPNHILSQQDNVVAAVDVFIKQIAFHTINYFDLALAGQFLGVGESLDYTMVRNRHGGMSILFGGRNQRID